MKVAYVITRFSEVGGAQVHVAAMANAIAEDGDQAVVYAGEIGRASMALLSGRVRVVHLPGLTRELNPGRDLQAVAHLVRRISEQRPDLVSAHSSKAGVVGRVASRISNVPSIFTAHGWSFTEGATGPRAGYVCAERLAARLCSLIIAVSEYDGRLALENRVVPRDRLRIIHNGMPDVGEKLTAGRVLSRSPTRFVSVARLDRQKDHFTLLSAVAGLPHKSLRLLLVGDGPLRAQLERAATELGIEDSVEFAGARSDVPGLLADSDVFVLSTNWEGLPRSIIEAMRAGLPAIATAVGGVPELIEDGRTGWLVPRGDAAALRDAMTRLVSSRELRLKMGAAARAKYLDAFTFERMRDRTLATYRMVLAMSV